MVDLDSLAAALGRVPSGIFVLAARHGEQETAMLASWVQQCSFDPPQVSVAVRRDRDIHDLLADGAAFTLNIVPIHATEFLKHFGKGFAPDAPAFEWSRTVPRNEQTAPARFERTRSVMAAWSIGCSVISIMRIS